MTRRGSESARVCATDMNNLILDLLLLGVLTLINAFFTGSEIAFVSLREGQLQRLEETNEKGRQVAQLARDPNRFLSTVQIFITLTGFFASAVAAVSLSAPLARTLEGPLGRAAQPISLVFVTLALAFVTLVVGELAPKRIAMQRAEGWAKFAIRPLRALSQLARPGIWVLDQTTNLLVKLSGGDPRITREEVTEEEIRDMFQAQQGFSPDQRSIIAGAFEVAERTLREIVVPRGQVLSFDQEMPAKECLEQLVQAGHSRAPVHRGDLDDVLGIIHVRDLIGNTDGPVNDHVRSATVVPESLGVLEALRELQGIRAQMAIVINEHGGVEGIITVEDLLEEIVGEIYDEFDSEIAQVERNADGSVELPGAFPIHDLTDVGIELPEHENNYSTIAGYVLERLGHIPTVGEVAKGPVWDVEVLDVEERTITKVLVKPAETQDSEGTQGSEQVNS